MEHIPILADEVADALVADAHGTYVDATFGRGGHTRVMLARLADDACVVALDRDPEAIAAAQTLAAQEPRLIVVEGRFSELETALVPFAGRFGAGLSGVLMDLGVSSPQLDDPNRGFSFRFDAPLDMRMDPGSGESAAEWLAAVDETSLRRVLRELGEERYAGRITRAILARRAEAPLETTAELVAVIESAQPRPDPHKHAATRVFQAIRMHVNAELDELRSGLDVAFEQLAPGGRLAVLSFHSIEDRLVKRRFRDWVRGEQMPRRLPVAGTATARAREIVRSQSPGAAEIEANPRARSARLRVIEKIA